MKKNATTSIVRAVTEALEGRTCMSGTISLTSGVLLLQADPNLASVMQVQFDANHNFVTAYTPYNLQRFPTAQIKEIVIVGSNKNDSIYIDPRLDLPASISGGAGNDTIHGGTGFDTIQGGDGDDLIYAHGIISTGSGNDTVWGSNQGDQMFGGSGNDLLIGGSGNDTIVGGSGHSTVIGGLGNDKLYAGTGTTVIRGAWGHDTLVGGPGHDTLYGGGGGNTLYRGSSNNVLNAATGDVVSSHTPPLDPTDPTNRSSSTAAPVQTPSVPTQPSQPTAPTAPSTPPTTTTSTPPSTTTTGSSVVKAVITQLETNIIAGEGVNVNALSSTLSSAGPLNTQYHWDFGDPGSEYNDLPGWTAGHIYDKPGVYTITLQITDVSGATSTAISHVTVASDNRPVIYVDSASGLDSNNGLSENAAVQTASRAMQLAGSDTIIEFRRGESFPITQTMNIIGHDVMIGAYGSGADPVLVHQASADFLTIYAMPASYNVTIQDLTFDSIYPAVNGVADKTGYSGIEASGTNVVVRRCTALNIDDFINGEQRPTGVIVQDNQAPLETGLRGYMCWLDGTNWTILGNYVYNSTREHGIRGNDTALSGVLIYDNNIQQHLSAADPAEVVKTTINIRAGNFVYINGNKLTNGTVAFAPGPGMDASEPVQWIVIEDNYINDCQIYVRDFTRHMVIRDNYFNFTWTADIHLYSGDSSLPDDYLSDITITHNTGINPGTNGEFLQLTGIDTTGGITVTNNLYVAPNLQLGWEVNSAVYLENAGDLKAFKLIANNVWPAATGDNKTVPGAVNYLGGSNFPTGFVTADQWNAMAQVHNDTFEDLTLPGGTYQTTLNGYTVGAVNFNLTTVV